MKNIKKFSAVISLVVSVLALTSCNYFGLKMTDSYKNPELDDNKTYHNTGKKRPSGNIALMEKQIQKKLERIKSETAKARKDVLISESYPDLKDTPEKPKEFQDKAKLKQEIIKDIENLEEKEQKIEPKKPKLQQEEQPQLLFNSGKISEEPIDIEHRQKSSLVYGDSKNTKKTGTSENQPRVENEPVQHREIKEQKTEIIDTKPKHNTYNYVQPVAPKKAQPIIPQSRYNSN